jgi:hypothetical protein
MMRSFAKSVCGSNPIPRRSMRIAGLRQTLQLKCHSHRGGNERFWEPSTPGGNPFLCGPAHPLGEKGIEKGCTANDNAPGNRHERLLGTPKAASAGQCTTPRLVNWPFAALGMKTPRVEDVQAGLAGVWPVVVHPPNRRSRRRSRCRASRSKLLICWSRPASFWWSASRRRAK